jgi:four helix bundle protein
MSNDEVNEKGNTVMTNKRIFDLEERLIAYAVWVMNVVEELPNTRVGNHLSGQLVRSGTASALMYGEAQSAESRKDFMHKMKIALKELRETLVCLKMIQRKSDLLPDARLTSGMQEGNELVAIFVKSVETARRNDQRQL